MSYSIEWEHGEVDRFDSYEDAEQAALDMCDATSKYEVSGEGYIFALDADEDGPCSLIIGQIVQDLAPRELAKTRSTPPAVKVAS